MSKSGGHAWSFSRRVWRPSNELTFVPRNIEGAGKAGRRLTPMAPVRTKSTGQEPQVQPDEPSLSLRDGFNACFVLSLGTGCLAPITRAGAFARNGELGLSIGRPGPHDFASASMLFVRASQSHAATRHVHRLPASRLVTTARTPLSLRRDGWRIDIDSEKKKEKF